jgi:hypothetical protein
MWLKYRHKFSSGSGGEWSWKILSFDDTVPSKDILKDTLTEIRQEYEWSEQYRGVEHEVVSVPPQEVILMKIGETRSRIQALENFSRYLQSLVEPTAS